MSSVDREAQSVRAAQRRLRVLRMEPVVGDERGDERTAPAPGTTGSAVGPTTQDIRQFEGQTVTLAQLQGLGRLEWQNEHVARLDTATESYLLEVQPLEPSG